MEAIEIQDSDKAQQPKEAIFLTKAYGILRGHGVTRRDGNVYKSGDGRVRFDATEDQLLGKPMHLSKSYPTLIGDVTVVHEYLGMLQQYVGRVVDSDGVYVAMHKVMNALNDNEEFQQDSRRLAELADELFD